MKDFGLMLGSKFTDKMGSATFLVALLCGVSLAYRGTVGIERALGGHLVQNATDNCTESSQSPSYWRIENFVLKVYNWESGGSTGTFGFTSYFSATNTTVECMAQDVDLAKLANGPWSECKSAGTEFRFDLTDISLTMKETWTCLGSPG
jgi:hypothetical protein